MDCVYLSPNNVWRCALVNVVMNIRVSCKKMSTSADGMSAFKQESASQRQNSLVKFRRIIKTKK